MALGWRSNDFKGETTIFNNHRNSNENAVLNAAKTVAGRLKVPIVVLNDINHDESKAIIDSSEFLFHLSESFNYSHSDYMAIISSSSAFLSGPSGAMNAGSILSKPTLLFDWPSFHVELYNPWIYYLPSQLTGPNGFIHSHKNRTYNCILVNELPYNGISITKKGFHITALSQSSLALEFGNFIESIIKCSTKTSNPKSILHLLQEEVAMKNSNILCSEVFNHIKKRAS